MNLRVQFFDGNSMVFRLLVSVCRWEQYIQELATLVNPREVFSYHSPLDTTVGEIMDLHGPEITITDLIFFESGCSREDTGDGSDILLAFREGEESMHTAIARFEKSFFMDPRKWQDEKE